MAALSLRAGRAVGTPGLTAPGGPNDAPPTIEFSWTPAGAVDLRDFKGIVKLTDDRGLDFGSYRMELVELQRTLDIPMGASMLGKEYELPLFLWVYADKMAADGHSSLTVRISVADTAGQTSLLERSIEIKRGPATIQLKSPTKD